MELRLGPKRTGNLSYQLKAAVRMAKWRSPRGRLVSPAALLPTGSSGVVALRQPGAAVTAHVVGGQICSLPPCFDRTWDVRQRLESVCELDFADLAVCRVRLLGGHRVHTEANALLEWTSVKLSELALAPGRPLAGAAEQLSYRRHRRCLLRPWPRSTRC
jgi:hypothetical protein